MELKEQLQLERKQLRVLYEQYKAMLAYYESRIKQIDSFLSA